MASVLLRGVFEPGSVVKLFQVADESVLRAENGEHVESRVADEAGAVGFENVPATARFIAVGFDRYQKPVEYRARALEDGELVSELHQAPITATNPPVGTQEAPNPPTPPAPAPEHLEVGIPEGVQAELAEPPAAEAVSSEAPGEAAGPTIEGAATTTSAVTAGATLQEPKQAAEASASADSAPSEAQISAAAPPAESPPPPAEQSTPQP